MPSTPLVPTAAPSTPAPSTAISAELIRPGSLLICLSYGRTRFAELDAEGKPFGVDVEIGQGIAAAMNLAPVFVETPFDELIEAVPTGLCDVSIGGQFITQARLELIDMIPYREGTPHVVVQINNPQAIEELNDLCGRRFAAVSGTIFVDMVVGTGDYVGAGLDDRCAADGSPLVDLVQYTTQQEAENALADATVDAYAGNDFVVRDRPDQFEWAVELPRVRNGIGHRLDSPALDEEIRAALRSMIADGSYLAILTTYDVEEVALTVDP